MGQKQLCLTTQAPVVSRVLVQAQAPVQALAPVFVRHKCHVLVVHVMKRKVAAPFLTTPRTLGPLPLAARPDGRCHTPLRTVCQQPR